MATTTATAGALVLGEPTPPTPVFKRLGQAALVVATLATIVLLLFPGLIAHTSPIATSDNILKPPSSAYWFGTDQLGRDVFSRTVYGARPVLVASLLGVVLATLAGVALGVMAGIERADAAVGLAITVVIFATLIQAGWRRSSASLTASAALSQTKSMYVRSPVWPPWPSGNA